MALCNISLSNGPYSEAITAICLDSMSHNESEAQPWRFLIQFAALDFRYPQGYCHQETRALLSEQPNTVEEAKGSSSNPTVSSHAHGISSQLFKVKRSRSNCRHLFSTTAAESKVTFRALVSSNSALLGASH
jgi:hypothetical protein